MKKFLLTISIAFFLTISLALNVDGEQKPKHGGVLTTIAARGPHVAGYAPEMGPMDYGVVGGPCVAYILVGDKEGSLTPIAAKSVDLDKEKLTVTIRLHKGAKFHDGSDFNAEACVWNYQNIIKTKKMQFYEMIKSIEIVDDYTVVLHLTGYNNQILWSYGLVAMFSKEAFEKNGVEWCRRNPVGSGPYKLAEWKRDSHMKWVKFDDYYRKGKPYMDEVLTRFIPDPVTAKAIMLAKEADLWTDPTPKDMAELESRGILRQEGTMGWPEFIYFNTSNPQAPTADQRVRAAIEHAIDKVTIAKVVGFGYYDPMKMMSVEGEWGYDTDWPGRPYNPEMAKKLLADAGYPGGLKLKILCLPSAGGRNTTAEAIKDYLADVGILADIDIADPGRFFGSLWGKGWEHMALFICGVRGGYDSLRHFQSWFGHQPRTRLASLKKPDELLALSKKAILLADKAEQAAVTKKLVRIFSDHALALPLHNRPSDILVQPGVHSYYEERGRLDYWPIWKE